MHDLKALIIIVLEILDNPKNNKTNLWSAHNSIILNKIILNIWIKWVIDLRYKKSEQNEDFGFRLTKYKTCQVGDFLCL